MVAANLWTSNFFANSFCVYGFDQFIVPIKLKYDRKYRHLGSSNLVSKFELQAAIYVANSFLVAIVLHVHCTVMYYHTYIIHKKFCFVHTNTFCKYRKKLCASPRVYLVVIIIFENISPHAND